LFFISFFHGVFININLLIVFICSERRQQLRQHEIQSGVDYRCEVEGYYGTAGGRRGSFDQPAPPLLTASEEELHEKTAIFGQTQTMAYPGLVHCTVGSGSMPHQTCLTSGGTRPTVGLRSGYTPALAGTDLCADCCIGGDYDRRTRSKLTGTLCHGVDVTMTTAAPGGGPPGTTRLPPSGDRLPHTHVYELPHAV
jgi:hypothetical protein